jgi:hypothetical protein
MTELFKKTLQSEEDDIHKSINAVKGTVFQRRVSPGT